VPFDTAAHVVVEVRDVEETQSDVIDVQLADAPC
jgi:hypothetical protein